MLSIRKPERKIGKIKITFIGHEVSEHFCFLPTLLHKQVGCTSGHKEGRTSSKLKISWPRNKVHCFVWIFIARKTKLAFSSLDTIVINPQTSRYGDIVCVGFHFSFTSFSLILKVGPSKHFETSCNQELRFSTLYPSLFYQWGSSSEFFVFTRRMTHLPMTYCCIMPFLFIKKETEWEWKQYFFHFYCIQTALFN